jgi:hypothetical protein
MHTYSNIYHFSIKFDKLNENKLSIRKLLKNDDIGTRISKFITLIKSLVVSI